MRNELDLFVINELSEWVINQCEIKLKTIKESQLE